MEYASQFQIQINTMFYSNIIAPPQAVSLWERGLGPCATTLFQSSVLLFAFLIFSNIPGGRARARGVFSKSERKKGHTISEKQMIVYGRMQILFQFKQILNLFWSDAKFNLDWFAAIVRKSCKT